MRLVVDNGPAAPAGSPAPAPTAGELRGEAQQVLVQAAKRCPLRVVVVADLGDGETGVWTSDSHKGNALALARIGLKTLAEELA